VTDAVSCFEPVSFAMEIIPTPLANVALVSLLKAPDMFMLNLRKQGW
jgi:hypothetical protein